jgi:hypothetical protein
MSSSSGVVSPSVSLGSFFEVWQQAHSMEGVDLEDRAKVVEAFRTGGAARAGSWHRLRSECGLLGGYFRRFCLDINEISLFPLFFFFC